ncbi:uncharacterized protein, possibly involved in utilization of glycolate and propanediol [Mycobacterium sp. JS623]|uniref:GlcG/HbpS family heme-binding protein n=1 Tax=Mycobacterium sp. JS623 TaxID=212767 RepID=UPI0002A5AA5F|nr:heme-binding protein [Mycobacterium sp. JS623]AGB22180.1 uncharacterized protein, possibly involved in utilization of glycolate and propanediol [Mycobacterium sp. JS623]
MDHGQALGILNAGIAKATEMGVPMTIAVVDASADLVAQVRMDGAYRYTVEISRGKAMVSAILLQPSGAVADDNPVSQKLNQLNHDQMVFVQGAVPLFVDGVPIGAVGASGGLPAMDEEVATVAAAAVG